MYRKHTLRVLQGHYRFDASRVDLSRPAAYFSLPFLLEFIFSSSRFRACVGLHQLWHTYRRTLGFDSCRGRDGKDFLFVGVGALRREPLSRIEVKIFGAVK